MSKNDSTQENSAGWDLGSLFGQDTANSTSTDTQNSSDNEENKQEIPIIDSDEALRFGMKELGKIMRDDGHQIELKVIGNINYRVGAWIRTFIPSFGEDGMFFITKAQQEAGAESEWITSLTLVDYPPSLSKGDSNIDGEESTSDSSSETEESESDSSEDESSENESSDGENDESQEQTN